MKVKPRGIEIPLIVLLVVLSAFVLGALGLLVFRLASNGVFEQQTVAQTEMATSKIPAEIVTQDTTTEVTEEETTTAKETEAEEEKASETEKETTTAVQTTTVSETKASETKASETKASESKTEKSSDTTKKTEQKTEAAKTEDKGGKTTATTAENKDAEKDPVSIYQKFMRDELAEKTGLANVADEKRALENKGLSSVLIRDFSNSGDLEMLVIRTESFNEYYAPTPVFELYSLNDDKPELLSTLACQYPMSEWYVRTEGNSVYLFGKQADVNGSEDDLFFLEIDLSLSRHRITEVKKMTTTGDPNGPVKSFTDNASWVCEITNRLADANQGNEGRLYKLSDYTGLRDWIK